jgi:hypothetical protein
MSSLFCRIYGPWFGEQQLMSSSLLFYEMTSSFCLVLGPLNFRILLVFCTQWSASCALFSRCLLCQSSPDLLRLWRRHLLLSFKLLQLLTHWSIEVLWVTGSVLVWSPLSQFWRYLSRFACYMPLPSCPWRAYSNNVLDTNYKDPFHAVSSSLLSLHRCQLQISAPRSQTFSICGLLFMRKPKFCNLQNSG